MATAMKTPIAGRVVVVTGGASGIGEALCKRFAAEGARVVVVADRDATRARSVARALPHAEAAECDVANEASVQRMVNDVTARHGAIDVYCSNAGIILAGTKVGGARALFAELRVVDSERTQMSDSVSAQSNADWQRIWEINVLSHVYAFRALLPQWRARKEGHFLVTASAAGLLSQIGDASYATTKHAAVGFAETVAITHGDEVCVEVGVRPFSLS